MNSDQLMGVLRAIIPGIAAAVSHWGIGNDAQNTLVITAVATGVVAAWSYYTNKPGTVIPTK